MGLLSAAVHARVLGLRTPRTPGHGNAHLLQEQARALWLRVLRSGAIQCVDPGQGQRVILQNLGLKD